MRTKLYCVSRYINHNSFCIHYIHLHSRYKVGEAFLHMPHSRAINHLEKDQAGITIQVSSLSASAGECETKMKELKVALYAKFGRAINLDD